MTAAPSSHSTVMKPNAFERLIAGYLSQNQTFMLAKNSPKDNKDRLFNECARYVNSLGGKFPQILTRCGRVIHSVVVTLCNIIWNLDNQMGRFVELAGGMNTIPAFVHSFGQNADLGIDGIENRVLWDDFVKKKIAMKQLSSASLLAHSLSLNELLFFSCINIPAWTEFKSDIRQIADALERVAKNIQKKAKKMQELRSNISSYSSASLPLTCP